MSSSQSARFGRAWRRVFFLLGSLVAALFLVEACCRITKADMKALWPILYKELWSRQGETSLARPSSHPRRIYELVPNTDIRRGNCLHPDETKYASVRFRINGLGFRGEERAAEKPRGVYRIVVFGGSNTFGTSVSDEDAYPALLEAALNKKRPGRFQVWNAGLPAYMMSQNAAYAREVVSLYDPDLLIFQDTNRGRRAFLGDDADFGRHFEGNNELFLENLPFAPFYDTPFESLHKRLVGWSASYRLAVACLNKLTVRFILRHTGRPMIQESLWARYGDDISRRDLRAFVRDFPRLKTVMFYLDGPEPGYDFLPHISLRDALADKPPAFHDIHPPSYVYGFYADVLVEKLTEMGMLG